MKIQLKIVLILSLERIFSPFSSKIKSLSSELKLSQSYFKKEVLRSSIIEDRSLVGLFNWLDGKSQAEIMMGEAGLNQPAVVAQASEKR